MEGGVRVKKGGREGEGGMKVKKGEGMEGELRDNLIIM